MVLIFYSEGSKSRAPEKDLQSLTVERLRALLREKGLSARGKKARIRALLSFFFFFNVALS